MQFPTVIAGYTEKLGMIIIDKMSPVLTRMKLFHWTENVSLTPTLHDDSLKFVPLQKNVKNRCVLKTFLYGLFGNA